MKNMISNILFDQHVAIFSSDSIIISFAFILFCLHSDFNDDVNILKKNLKNFFLEIERKCSCIPSSSPTRGTELNEMTRKSIFPQKCLQEHSTAPKYFLSNFSILWYNNELLISLPIWHLSELNVIPSVFFFQLKIYDL